MYNLLIHGQTVLDCLIKLNEMIKNEKTAKDFRKRKEIFTEHYQLSDNEVYLKELNDKVLTWYQYCRKMLDRYPDDILDKMDRFELEELKRTLLDDVERLTSDDTTFEEKPIIKDNGTIQEIEETVTDNFPKLVEKCKEPDDFSSGHETLTKIIRPAHNWKRLTMERLSKKINGEEESDFEYFRFLRSICAVHPIETTNHEMYLKAGSACAFASHNVVYPSIVEADYYATIYRIEGDVIIPIKVDQIIEYLKKSFDFLSEEAVKGLQRLSEEEIESFRRKRMMEPGDDYMLYLKQLLKQVEVRYGDYKYIVKHWIRVFRTHYTDPVMEEHLERYKECLKEKIAISHQEIQEMCWEDDS